jgi:hypothetical protein
MKKGVFFRFRKGKLGLLFKIAINKANSIKKLSELTGIDQRRIYDYANENYGNKFGVRRETINKIIKFLKFKDKNIKKYIIKEVHSDWTKEELKFLIKNYKYLTAREIYKKLGRSIYSIKDQRKKLNLKKGPRYRWYSKEKIINRFKELYKRLGKTPTYQECEKFDGGMMNAINVQYKRYSNFLNELNLKTKFNKWDREKCIKKFKEFIEKYSYLPTNHEPLYKAIIRRWGTYHNFLKEIKVNKSLIRSYKWKEWEDLVIKICKKMYRNVLIKNQLNGKRLYPDLSILDNNGKVIKLIDAKLNSYSNGDNISRYYQYCKNIEIWSLYGHKNKSLIKDGIKIISYNKILEDLKRDNLNEFIEKIEELRKPC